MSISRENPASDKFVEEVSPCPYACLSLKPYYVV